MYAVTSELFPTVIKNTAMGCCSMAARIATIISSFIIYLGKYMEFFKFENSHWQRNSYTTIIIHEALWVLSKLTYNTSVIFFNFIITFLTTILSCRTIFQGTPVHIDGTFSHFWCFLKSPAARNIWEGFTRDHITNSEDMQVSSLTAVHNYQHTCGNCKGHGFVFGWTFNHR